ncbi:MAG: nucleoside hydrolase [Alphaproteobacteria bacterium]|nr:nucleoside hydrolase [Alphaproteobacteria bacterium]
MSGRPVIVDCDPGLDDAIALLLALASPEEIDLLGITCVAGNVPLAMTERNARIVVELSGRRDVPVHAGCPRPLLRPLNTGERVHGKTGLDGYDWPAPSLPLADAHAVDFIIATCLAADDGAITLCPVGPMTNVATAIVKEPRILPKLREIAFMGGAALVPGNVTPVAEFNIHADPHAARIVLESGARLTMFGLDVTHKAITTPERLDAIRGIGTPAAAAAAAILTFYDRADIERYGARGGPLHDPCVIAYLLRPALFSGKECHVAVETESELTMGQTVADWWGVTGKAASCRVVTGIDADGYYALIRERLACL